MTTLRTLIDILSAAVGKIEDQYAAAGLELPSLNDPFDMSKPGDAMLFSPDVARQASVVVAAAEQLSVTVRPPQFVLLESTLSVSQDFTMFPHCSLRFGPVPQDGVCQRCQCWECRGNPP